MHADLSKHERDIYLIFSYVRWHYLRHLEENICFSFRDLFEVATIDEMRDNII